MLLVVGSVGAQEYFTLPVATGSGTANDPYIVTLGNGEYKTGTDFDNKYVEVIGQGSGNTTLWYGSKSGYNSGGEGGSEYTFEGAHVTFKDVALKDVNGDKPGYDGFVRCSSLSFEDCTLTSMLTYLGVGPVVFKNCTFNHPDGYTAWLYGSQPYEFDGCTFNVGNRVFNVYAEGAITPNIVMNNCTIIGNAHNKAVFAIKGSANGCTININNSTCTGLLCADSDAAVNGGVWYQMEGSHDKNNVILDGVAINVNGVAQNIAEEAIPAVATTDAAVAIEKNETATEEETTTVEAVVNAVVENTATVNAATAIAAEAVEGVESTKNYLHIDVKAAEVAKNDESVYVKSMTFDIKPIAATITDGKLSTAVIPNSAIKSAITFRLPVDSKATETMAEVFHNGESMGANYQVQGTTEKYIEVSTTSFSEFGYNLLDEGPAGPDFTAAVITITTDNDLVALATYVNAGNTLSGKTVKLANDIDMTGVANFAPIGTASNKFYGTFDGQNNTISNLKATTNGSYVGLFGCVYDATIKDVKLVDAVVSNESDYAAALVGSGYVRIENCEISGGSVTGAEQVGAVIGYLSCGHVKNCTVDGVAVKATSNRVGGLVGKANVDSGYEISGNTVKNATVTAANKVGEMCSAAGLVGQIMASVANSWSITDNNIINVTTKSATDETFVPVGEFRSGYFQANAVTAGHIVRNHWEPATEPDSYNMVNPANAEESVVINNFYAVAQIEGGLRYATLAEAVAAANANDEIILIADQEISSAIEIAKNLTLNLNGKTITNNVASNRLFRVGGVTFTIDGTGEGSSMIIPETNKYSFGFVDMRNNSGTASADAKLVLNGGYYEGATLGGAFFKGRTHYQTFELNDVHCKCTAGDGQQYYANGYFYNGDNASVVNAHSGSFPYLTTLKVEGGLYEYATLAVTASNVFQGKNYMTDGKSSVSFDDVKVVSTHGPIYELSAGEMSINNCDFTIEGEAIWQNSALCASNNAVLNVEGGKYNAPYAVYALTSGATININGGDFTASKSLLVAGTDNYYPTAVSTINVYDGTFKYTGSKPSEAIYTYGNRPVTIAISGGSFSVVVAGEYCAEGFTPVTEADANGMYTVEELTEDNAFVVLENIVGEQDVKVFYNKAQAAASDIELNDYAAKKVVVKENVEVKSITYKRKFTTSGGNWQSWIVPFNTEVGSDVQFAKLVQVAYVDATTGQIVTDAKDGELFIVIDKLVEGDEVSANYPYFIKVPSNGEYVFTSSDNVLYETDPKSLSTSTTTTSYDFYGVYAAETHKDIYMMSTQGLYSYMTTDKVVNPYRWYFTATSKDQYGEGTPAMNASNVRVLVLGEEAEATAILNAVQDMPTSDAPIFDLSGRRVQHAAKGILIQNGKKFINK